MQKNAPQVTAPSSPKSMLLLACPRMVAPLIGISADYTCMDTSQKGGVVCISLALQDLSSVKQMVLTEFTHNFQSPPEVPQHMNQSENGLGPET